MISGFRRDVNEICKLLGYYAAYNDNSVPTFRDNLSVWSLRIKQSNVLILFCPVPKWNFLPRFYAYETWQPNSFSHAPLFLERIRDFCFSRPLSSSSIPGKSDLEATLNTDLHLVLRQRISWAIPPLLHAFIQCTFTNLICLNNCWFVPCQNRSFVFDCTGLNNRKFPSSPPVLRPLQYYLNFTAGSDCLYWIPSHTAWRRGVLEGNYNA
jgi:hypothetical protein